MRLSPFLGLAGLSMFALAGCADEPSYAFRWRIEPRDGDPTVEVAPDDERMTTSSLCSRNGVYSVRLWIFESTFNQLVDIVDRPCFPEAFRNRNAAINGNPLPPDDYLAVMHGLRANGQPWLDCDFNDEQQSSTALGCANEPSEYCNDGECAVGSNTCDCQTFTVREDEKTRLDDFVLGAPPECEDGIDSDEDGLVDDIDPGCQVSNAEGTPVLIPELLLDISFFGTDSATCSGGVGTLELSIDGQVVETLPCRAGAIRLSAPLAEGPHDLSIQGLSIVGPVTNVRTFEFEVLPSGVAQPAELAVDFSDVDFLEPIVSAARFTVQLELPAEDGVEPEQVQCKDKRVGVADYAMTMLDAAGEPLSPSVASQVDGRALDGSIASCVSAQVITDPLEWGAYQVSVEAFNADGDLCFATESPRSLVPNAGLPATLVLVEDAPESCLNP